MESRRDNVVSSLLVRVVVAPGLCDVDLTRQWPISVRVIDGHHPDCWPQPISLSQLCSDFNPAILDAGSLLCVDAARLHRINNCICRLVCDCHTVVEERRGTKPICGKVDDAVGIDEGSILKSRFDNELSILDEDILICCCGLLKLTIAAPRISMSFDSVYVKCLPKSTDFSLLSPYISIETAREVITYDRIAVFVVDHGCQPIVDQETSNSQSKQ